ncbi:MAG: hypothetical protein KHY93_07090 [Clostridiales bacterium]|nr:hypothetical protein [Clostridiales bacterium]
MFGVLFIYMIFSAFLYMTSDHIESYQVTSGPLSRNETYTGLAIREETVVQAESGGYVNYYAREGNKINANGAVYALSTSKSPEGGVQLDQEELDQIRSDMMSFSKGFSSSQFHNTYGFKYQLEGSILQYSGVTGESTAPLVSSGDGEEEISEENLVSMEPVTLGNQTISKAQADGIVLYSKDGYEGKTADTITAEDFDQNSYHETDLKTQKKVEAGDDIYTLITDERWSLLIPLSEKQASRLADRTVMRVKFLKDGMTQSGDFSIVEIEGGKYGKLDFNKGLVRYASDRFLDIELVTNTVTGLKIPLSSVVTKEFYTIPSAFASSSKGGEEGFFIAGKNKSGDNVTTFVTPTVYARVEQEQATSLGSEETEEKEPSYIYYVDKNAFKEGDAVINPDSQERYIIGETAVLEGAYCINQGYAVFRRIEVLDQNEEYAIVSKGTSYGLSRYDHIVRDASEVKEEDILY